MTEPLSTPPNISERPRERLIRHGTDALTSAELLSVILGTGLPGTPVLDFAHGLLKRFGGVRGLLAASTDELRCVAGMGTARVCSLAAILALARRAGAARLQLHRTDPAGWPDDFPLPCAFVTSVDAEGIAHGPLAPPPHLVQLDTAHAKLLGGTGRTFPWDRARALCGGRPFMLAGGLGADNVAAALAAASPFGVDAASRLESAPGIKDRDQVRRFVAAVREFDEHHCDPA